MSLMVVDAAKRAAEEAFAEPPVADAASNGAHPMVSCTDDDPMVKADDGGVTRITVDPAPAHESSTPREMPPPMAKSRMSSDHSMHSMRI